MQVLSTIISLIIVFISLTGNAQITFENVYGAQGEEHGYGMVQLPDSSYMIVGSTTSFGDLSSNLLVMKIDSAGNFIRTRSYGGPNVEVGKEIILTDDGNLAAIGYTNSYGAGGYDIYFVKMDYNGDFLFSKTFGGSDWDLGYSLAQTPDGGYIITGETYSSGNGKNDAFVLKIDAVGDSVWSTNLGDNESQKGNAVIHTLNNKYIIAGEWENNANLDGYLACLNADGSLLWDTIVKTDVSDSTDVLNDVIQAPNGSIYAAGYSSGSGLDDTDHMRVRYDSLGNQYYKVFSGGTAKDESVSLVWNADLDRPVILAQTTSSGILDGFYDINFFATSRFWGGYNSICTGDAGRAYDDIPSEIIYTHDKSMALVATMFNSTTGYNGIYVSKLAPNCDPNGTQQDFLITSLKERENNQLKVFPNPSNEKLNFNSRIKINAIEISDIQGRVISKIILPGSILNVSEFTPGVYFFKFSLENDVIVTNKVIIQ